MSPPAVAVEGFGRTYGSVRALDGIDVTVRDGEVFGLVGRNGAGKTTTLRTIATLLSVEEGAVSVYGTDVDADPAGARERLSDLPEDAGASDTLTGRQFLAFTADFYDGDTAAMVALAARLYRSDRLVTGRAGRLAWLLERLQW